MNPRIAHSLFIAGFLLWVGAMVLTLRGFSEGTIIELNPYMNYFLHSIPFPFAFLPALTLFVVTGVFYIKMEKFVFLVHTPEQKRQVARWIPRMRFFFAAAIFGIFLRDFTNDILVYLAIHNWF